MAKRMNEIICPTCGENLKYDPKTGMNHCEACNNYYFIDYTNSNEKIIEETSKAHCPNCGGFLSFEPGTDIVRCSSCDSTFEIVNPEKIEYIDSDFEPEYIIPFSVTENELKYKFLEVVSQTDHIPTDVFDKVNFDYIKGYYQPYYKFEAVYEADYTANIGFDRKEQYEDYETVYENGQRYKKRVIKERTVTDWHPTSGHTQGKMTLWASAIKNKNENRAYSPQIRSSVYDKTIVELENAYDQIIIDGFSKGKNYNSQYMTGFEKSPFSKDADLAWKDCGSEVNQIIENDVSQRLSGDHVKDINWNSVSEVTAKATFYVPVWVVCFNYEDNHYTFIANGDDVNSCYISAPKDQNSLIKSKRFFIPLKICGFAALSFVILFILNFLFYHEDSLINISLIGCLVSGLLALATWGIGVLFKNNQLAEEKVIREQSKEKILNNIDGFFARTSSYKYEPSEKTDVETEKEELKQNSENKFVAFIKEHKKPVVISSSIIALLLIISIVLSNINLSNNQYIPVDNDEYINGTSSAINSESTFQNSNTNTENDSTNNSEPSSVGSTNANTGHNSTTNSKPTSGDSTNANTGNNSTTNSKPTSGGSTNTDPCANGHNWIAITETIHHDEEGHYDMVEVKSESKWYRCPICGSEFTSLNSYYSHFDSSHLDPLEALLRGSYTQGTIPAEYDEKWIVDKKAYDEIVTTGYKCEVCGKTK